MQNLKAYEPSISPNYDTCNNYVLHICLQWNKGRIEVNIKFIFNLRAVF